MKNINFDLLCTDESYDVEIEDEETGKITNYTLYYHYEENVGWRNITIYNEEGEEIKDEELRKSIIKIFDEK
jgi:hypothetical protein